MLLDFHLFFYCDTYISHHPRPLPCDTSHPFSIHDPIISPRFTTCTWYCVPSHKSTLFIMRLCSSSNAIMLICYNNIINDRRLTRAYTLCVGSNYLFPVSQSVCFSPKIVTEYCRLNACIILVRRRRPTVAATHIQRKCVEKVCTTVRMRRAMALVGGNRGRTPLCKIRVTALSTHIAGHLENGDSLYRLYHRLYRLERYCTPCLMVPMIVRESNKH